MITIDTLLQAMIKYNASDLHISAASPPILRIDGKLKNLDLEPLDASSTKKIVYSMLTESQISRFEKELELDFSFTLKETSRFRVNVYKHRGTIGACLRAIPVQIRNFEELSLPVAVCKRVCELPQGLVLMTGATGSGKTTTIAAMIEHINQTQATHIITVEDPVEYVFKSKKSLITQREVAQDTHEFATALKHTLRQDPDVVVIGEIRDLETMQTALTIAETGHLTFATLHTNDSAQTITRIIDSFPPHQQNQVRMQLSMTLEAVLSQQLIPRSVGSGRVLAMEILLANSAVRSLIRENKIHQIYSVIQTSSNIGMKTMNRSIFELYKSGVLSYNDALANSYDPEELKLMIKSGN